MRSITRAKLGYDLRQGRKELTERHTSRVMINAPAPTPVSAAVDFGSLNRYMELDKDGVFNGTITARNISNEELIELIAIIRVKPGLAATIKVLDLANQDVRNKGALTSIPKLTGFTSLKTVNLVGHQLRSVPEGWLDDCAELEELNLKNNNIMILPKKLFKNCKNLKNINLSVNALEILHEELFEGCTPLTELNLSNNKIETLHDGLFDECLSLKNLDLGGNKIATLPEGLLKNCTALQVLAFDHNKLTELPKHLLKYCGGLTTLSLSYNQLIMIPEGFLDACLGLKRLEFNVNQLTTLPEDLLDKSATLTYLGLSDNNLIILPQRLLHKCLELQRLNIQRNKLTEIPADFVANCKKLTKFTHDDIPSATKPAISTPSSDIKQSDLPRHRAFHPKALHPNALYPNTSRVPLPKRPGNSSLLATEKRMEARLSNKDATVTITASEHAELMRNKAKTDELAQTVASQAAALEEIKLQLRDLNKAQAPVVEKPQFTPEEKATFVKTDALELKLADKLQDSRAATVNVLLEQANVLPQDSAQNQAMINKLQELIWGMRKAEERAANAEQIALMAIAKLRDFQEQTQQSLDFISKNMTENEAFLYEAIVRINKLGSAFTVLSAEMGKNNQYATVCNALNYGKHQGAATFLISFVSKFTTEETFAKLAVSRKFKFDYGTYGMVSDTLVAIANLVSFTGVGAGATLVQTAVRGFEDRKKVAKAKKIVNVSGRIVGGAEELATRIVVSILQLNGHLIANCADEVANAMAKMCFDAAIKYINLAPKDQAEISAEEIAYAIMSGKFLDQKSSYCGFILSFDSTGCLLATRAHPNNHAKPREWLSDTLMKYGNNPERLDNMLATPPRSASFSRKPSMTTKFDAFKADMQKRAVHPEEAPQQFKNCFVAN